MTKKKEKQLFAADTEFTTKELPSVAYCVGYCPVEEKPDPNKLRAFYGRQAMTEWILDIFNNCNQGAIIFFHNLRADYSYIYPCLKNNHLFKDIKIDESIFGFQKKIMQVSLTWHKKTIYLRDSYILFYAPLKAIMRGYNKVYRVKNHVEEYYEYVPEKLSPEFKHYFYWDILGLAEAVYQRWNIGRQKLTTSSDGWAIAKEITNNAYPNKKNAFENWFFPNLPRKLDKQLRPYYKGGFCYVNPRWQDKIIEQPVYVYDVNSMYPSIMRNSLLPYGKPRRVQNEMLGKLVQSNKLYLICFVVRWAEVKPNKLGFINNGATNSFLSTQYTGEISAHASRQFRTLHMTSIEFQLFRETFNYEIDEYVEGWEFDGAIGILAPFIDEMYKMKTQAKESGDAARYQGAKRLITTPSGKAGQNPESQMWQSELDSEGIQHFVPKQLSDKERDRDAAKSAKYLPLSIFITAHGRVKLIRHINKVGLKRFVYCDTDSCHTIGCRDGCFRISAYELGAWDNEAICKRSRYLRTKRYFHEFKRIGFRDNSQAWEGKGEPHEFKCAGIPAKYAKHIVCCEDFYLGQTVMTMTAKMMQGGMQLVPMIKTI